MKLKIISIFVFFREKKKSLTNFHYRLERQEHSFFIFIFLFFSSSITTDLFLKTWVMTNLETNQENIQNED